MLKKTKSVKNKFFKLFRVKLHCTWEDAVFDFPLVLKRHPQHRTNYKQWLQSCISRLTTEAERYGECIFI